MSNITTAPPLSATVIIVSRSHFVRLSRESCSVFEDFNSWLIGVMKVSIQLGNLSGNQLLFLLNLSLFLLFSADPKCALSFDAVQINKGRRKPLFVTGCISSYLFEDFLKCTSFNSFSLGEDKRKFQKD